jgi:esterase/lipase superfamily enzyme
MVLNQLYEALVDSQAITARDSSRVCRAKTSVIAHSMGNFLYEWAMEQTWTAHNQPQLLTLINQALMVAADVDNDIFNDNDPKCDGEAMANLSYRITALYTGKDNVLGASAALKHFGKRRLGRSGLDRTNPIPDNVWDADCSRYVPNGEKDVHSFYFKQNDIINLMRQVLQGYDRTVIEKSFLLNGNFPYGLRFLSF